MIAPLALAATLAAGSSAAADLTGLWTNASLTPLARPPGVKGAATEAEAKAIVARFAAATAADLKPTDPGAPPLPATDAVSIGYNRFWMESGAALARVNGEYRTSWIVEPADGQLPLTAAGQARAREANAMSYTLTATGPESLSPNDRCLISSRGTGGPGMLNNLYNSNYQIVQTPAAVTIVVEMIHDARIVPVFPSKAAAQKGHLPAALHPWLGDSVGWWEGGTFVIETVNVDPRQGRFGPIFLSANGRVTERLSRASAGELAYAFEVEDAEYYTRPWRAEMTFRAIKGPLYEFACHEGNYAMRGVLSAARAADGSSRGAGDR